MKQYTSEQVDQIEKALEYIEQACVTLRSIPAPDHDLLSESLILAHAMTLEASKHVNGLLYFARREIYRDSNTQAQIDGG